MPLPQCTRVDFDDDARRERLLADGWREIEVLETWRGPAPKGNGCARVIDAHESDIHEMQEIARTAFKYDRLHADPLVPASLANQSKADWVKDSWSKLLCRIFIYCDSGIAGFLCITPDGHIDLLAVREDKRGQGIARNLVTTACNRLGISDLEAGTQQINEPARRFYKSLGMTIVKRQRTFHK